ncbi:hypothetical protein MIR68_002489 [Amoeboaphelidium protococcarum]|nr:hypothetical protein MIR68_002489 [Amoeboaphelidium protococcarum]
MRQIILRPCRRLLNKHKNIPGFLSDKVQEQSDVPKALDDTSANSKIQNVNDMRWVEESDFDKIARKPVHKRSLHEHATQIQRNELLEYYNLLKHPSSESDRIIQQAKSLDVVEEEGRKQIVSLINPPQDLSISHPHDRKAEQYLIEQYSTKVLPQNQFDILKVPYYMNKPYVIYPIYAYVGCLMVYVVLFTDWDGLNSYANYSEFGIEASGHHPHIFEGIQSWFYGICDHWGISHPSRPAENQMAEAMSDEKILDAMVKRLYGGTKS